MNQPVHWTWWDYLMLVVLGGIACALLGVIVWLFI
jgi:hypothetical protein